MELTLMYLKPVSTASVTITASGPRRSARRCAPTTFAPVEMPAKTPSSLREPARHLERLVVPDRLDVVDLLWVPVRHRRSPSSPG